VPRPNAKRAIVVEGVVAKRIAKERTDRDWTYEALARKMTAAGCAIQPSAIYKIEKGNPPRRITVAEMVALAEVFDIPIDDLIAPRSIREFVSVLRGHLGLIGLQQKRIADQEGELATAIDVMLDFVDSASNAGIVGDLRDSPRRQDQELVRTIEALRKVVDDERRS